VEQSEVHLNKNRRDIENRVEKNTREGNEILAKVGAGIPDEVVKVRGKITSAPDGMLSTKDTSAMTVSGDLLPKD